MRLSSKRYRFVLLWIVTTCCITAQAQFERREVRLQGQSFLLQIAVSTQQRQQGLMHRRQLAHDAGMLFIYPRRGDHRIWMKNTLIPLTVIWLDDDLRIIHVGLLQPCRQQNCPIYSAPALSRYILELHPTQFERFRVGERLSGLRAALP